MKCLIAYPSTAEVYAFITTLKLKTWNQSYCFFNTHMKLCTLELVISNNIIAPAYKNHLRLSQYNNRIPTILPWDALQISSGFELILTSRKVHLDYTCLSLDNS